VGDPELEVGEFPMTTLCSTRHYFFIEFLETIDGYISEWIHDLWLFTIITHHWLRCRETHQGGTDTSGCGRYVIELADDGG